MKNILFTILLGLLVSAPSLSFADALEVSADSRDSVAASENLDEDACQKLFDIAQEKVIDNAGGSSIPESREVPADGSVIPV
jgi:hypothetical protein